MCALLVFGVLFRSANCTAAERPESIRWWRGNLHTHTLWSDGDGYPEMVGAWYKDHGYDFLCFSEHNVFPMGEKWVDVAAWNGGAEQLDAIRERFGEGWPVERRFEGRHQVRLKTFEEYAGGLNEPGRFLLIPSEEITDNFASSPVHLNATNLQELIAPQGGESVLDTLQNNVDAVYAQRERTGMPMFPHVNHPNFGGAVSADDLSALRGYRFFEIFNGHPGVMNYGAEHLVATEKMWDIVLATRLSRSAEEIVYGLATDDAHNYHAFGVGKVNPGRGWVMVRAAELEAAAIVAAMERGDFYASTGVTLRDVIPSATGLRVEVEPEAGCEYRIQFVGTRIGVKPRSDDAPTTSTLPAAYGVRVGEVFREIEGTSAEYRFAGDELYVRAKVLSNQPIANPYAAGDTGCAWTQPALPLFDAEPAQ